MVIRVKLKMTQKLVTVYKNGDNSKGTVFVLPETLQNLYDNVSSECNFVVKRIFIENGTEVKEVSFLRENDKLYISKGEDFVPVQKSTERIKCSDWVTLNVGGRCFTTSKRTLTTNEPSSMLARMFSEDEEGYLFTPSSVDKNGAFLIDRSPTYFEPILNYLRCGQLVYDKNINPAGILEEARFFGIESVLPMLEQVISQEKISRDLLPLTRRDVIDALIKSPYTAELRFQGVNLSGSDLSRLDLRYINFKYANLQGCNLMGSNLSWCCLERADLSKACLDNAQLLGRSALNK